MSTLYIKSSQRPLPPLLPGDQVLLIGDSLYKSWDVPTWGLIVDARCRGLNPEGVELIDHAEWVKRLPHFERCITC